MTPNHVLPSDPGVANSHLSGLERQHPAIDKHGHNDENANLRWSEMENDADREQGNRPL